MKHKDIKSLLNKFVRNECSDAEIQEVIRYFRKGSGSSDFPSVEEVLDMLDDYPEIDKSAADRIFRRVMAASEHNKPLTYTSRTPRKMIWWRYAAAIAVIVTMLAGYFIWKNPFSSPDDASFMSQTNEEVLVPDEEVITLERENGQIEIIHEDGSRQILDSEGNVIGEQEQGVLTYNSSEKPEQLVFNTLAVPYGKRFEVVLSDGTLVHLNAGTSLKYPVTFLESEKTREVYVTGEAYFEVARDTDHPFIVNSGELDVEVLGTKFNVSTYPEDEAANVVLVEGSVQLQPEANGEADPFLLKPGEKGRFVKTDHSMTKRRVATSIYTAWIKGELVFRNMTFEDILKKLERHYNISIINQNKVLAEEKFNASFGNEPVAKVLSYMKTMYGVDFKIKNNQVIVQ